MRLCMISLDAAAQPDLEKLMGMPHLKKLRQQGLYCNNVSTIYPTITYPIHVSLITGCFPSRHGIGHNQPFQPDTEKEMRRWFWEMGDIKVKTLHQAAREKGLNVASILWPVTGKAKCIRRNFPEVLPLPGENAALKMIRYASPLWLLKMEALHGKKRKSIRQPHLDDYAALLCEKLYASRRPPDVLTVHLVDLDAMRHWHGVESDAAHAAMERLDGRVGRIIAAVEKAGLLSDTLFCIVSDHGQKDAPQGILLDQMLKNACGARAQTLGMGAYIFGDDLKRAQAIMEENREAWGIDTILDDAALRRLNAPEDVKLAVHARDGFCFIDREEETLGEHGFSLDCPQARTLLLLSGPGIDPGMMESARLVDIAPTLAHLIGVSLPQAQGTLIQDPHIHKSNA
ncbi:MAG: alkaline phosphatase family protein [Clostridiales bacterium]|nr:alkaline phosphatase family protein [Clostridiales bacterium]